MQTCPDLTLRAPAADPPLARLNRLVAAGELGYVAHAQQGRHRVILQRHQLYFEGLGDTFEAALLAALNSSEALPC